MIDFQPGQVVYSKAGRDKGKTFLVVSLITERNGEYAYLTDGKARPLIRPKKKKLKHIQPTNTVLTEVLELQKNKNILDADIRKALKPYLNGFERLEGLPERSCADV